MLALWRRGTLVLWRQPGILRAMFGREVRFLVLVLVLVLVCCLILECGGWMGSIAGAFRCCLWWVEWDFDRPNKPLVVPYI